MSVSSSDFSGVCLKRLVEFCRKVDTIQQTPELIRLVADETQYVEFCRKITDPQGKFQRRFVAMCRTNRIDPDDIRRRMNLVATVLGIIKQVDYYKILGVPPDAGARAIRQAYREKAQILHPDKATGDDKDGATFIKLHDAYMHLNDPQIRDLYDQTRTDSGRWIEGNTSTRRFATGVGVGRFLSWMFISVGIMAIVVYTLDLYQDGRTPFLADNFPKDRMDGWHTVPLQMPDQSASRDSLTAPQGDSSEMAALRKYFPEPAPMGMERSVEPAEITDEIMFFNPMRKKRYWADETSRHESLDDAVAALAEMYHRTPEWVQSHMGEENTLQAVHIKLGMQKYIEATLTEKESVTTPKPSRSAPKVQLAKMTVSADVTMRQGQNGLTAPEVSVGEGEEPYAGKSGKASEVPTTKTSVQKQKNNDPVDNVKGQRRVMAFINQFTHAYEQKDLKRFQSFFAEDALEQGKRFEEMLPTYRNTFSLVEVLRYDIDMESCTIDDTGERIMVEGVFRASYRLPKKDWGSSSGSIRLELLDTPRGLLVSRLNYEMQRAEEQGVGKDEVRKIGR
jgi:hypothetical protein